MLLSGGSSSTIDGNYVQRNGAQLLVALGVNALQVTGTATLEGGGVRVNGILIGLVESGQWRRRFEAREDKSQDWQTWSANLAATKHIPLARLGLPVEAARALTFLVSPFSSYTTGSHIDVSGGHSRGA